MCSVDHLTQRPTLTLALDGILKPKPDPHPQPKRQPLVINWLPYPKSHPKASQQSQQTHGQRQQQGKGKDQDEDQDKIQDQDEEKNHKQNQYKPACAEYVLVRGNEEPRLEIVGNVGVVV